MGHSITQRQLVDRIAQYFVSAGGIAIIVAILAIFFFIFREITPLFSTPTARLIARVALPSIQSSRGPVRIGMDEHRQIAYALHSGGAHFIDLASGRPVPVEVPLLLSHQRITAIAHGGGASSTYLLGTHEGGIVPVKLGVTTSFSDSGERNKRPLLKAGQVLQVVDQPIVELAYRTGPGGQAFVALTEEGRLWFGKIPDDGDGQSPTMQELSGVAGRITGLALDSSLANLYAGTAEGLLYHFSLMDSNQPQAPLSYLPARSVSPIAMLGLLNGDRSLVVMTEDGGVSTWGLIRAPGNLGRFRLERMHELLPHRASITAFAPATRDKGFATADLQGQVFIHYATSEQTWLRFPNGETPVRSVAFSPKGDSLAALDTAGQMAIYELRNPFPEVTFKTLFGAVWYEGYDRPEHVWQSSSGSDEFEPKYGLMPLMFGTLKGTLYALLLALPISILAAIFTSQFMHPDLRGKIKPIVEMLAALPTVVLGFLAALWLAPLLERLFPALVGMSMLAPLVVVLASLVWHAAPSGIREWFRPGTEALLLIPLLVATIMLCLWSNEWWAEFFFSGDFKGWVVDKLGVQYDQRNAVVVGIVMGFAIVPVIYSIAEEALSNVPRILVAGSLALGATRWQTVWRLVLLAASPGIFSAIMIGFGRAIGETMIVLMATGNTPIMDWSWTNGFRTLSANIAVEIPEAPHGSALYRILFLAALLLFVFTFVINTVAEIVRQRLRQRYT
ncbi:MAG: ABC transporter permease subunit [Nitrospiraceae bacterium]